MLNPPSIRQMAFLAILSAVGSTFARGEPSAYRLVDLGELPGGIASESYSINASGQIAGFSFSPTYVHAAFKYSNGNLTSLGTLGGPNSNGLAINDLGDVVGEADRADNASHAFLSKDGVMTDLGSLAGVASRQGSVAVSINNADQVVGYSFITAGTRAFLYQNGAMKDLGTLGGKNSTAQHINNIGQIVGSADTKVGNTSAFFHQDGVMASLGTLGGASSEAQAINDHGQIVGMSDLSATSFRHAFLYDNVTMKDLGTIAGDSWASSINNAGQIVGSVNPLNPTTLTGYQTYVHGFLYQDKKMYDLTAYLQDANGWFVSEANSINDQGWIAGIGGNGANEHAILLIPVPEPATLSLVTLAMFCLRRRARMALTTRSKNGLS